MDTKCAQTETHKCTQTPFPLKEIVTNMGVFYALCIVLLLCVTNATEVLVKQVGLGKELTRNVKETFYD